MEANDIDEDEEFGFSRNYFLAKELRGSGKKSAKKLSDIDVVDDQVLFYLERYISFDNLPKSYQLSFLL